MRTYDCIIIGGGIVGLTTAWELSRRGLKTLLFDRQDVGREASWAAAGMLPPIDIDAPTPEFQQLFRYSSQRWPNHVQELQSQTGLETDYRQCGSSLLYNSPEQLASGQAFWQAHGFQTESLQLPNLKDRLGFHIKEHRQLNPRLHLSSLSQACLKQGVLINAHEEVVAFRTTTSSRNEHAEVVVTNQGEYASALVLIAGGSWTERIGKLANVQLPTTPIRGQILLLKPPKFQDSGIIERKQQYIVARPDGTVVIGSTMEDVGFEHGVTEQGTKSLLDFAHEVFPEYLDAPTEKWSGLRPATPDGLPWLGRAGNFDNLWVCSGHFRNGILLSPGTAHLIAQAMLHEQIDLDLTPFSPNRPLASPEVIASP